MYFASLSLHSFSVAVWKGSGAAVTLSAHCLQPLLNLKSIFAHIALLGGMLSTRERKRRADSPAADSGLSVWVYVGAGLMLLRLVSRNFYLCYCGVVIEGKDYWLIGAATWKRARENVWGGEGEKLLHQKPTEVTRSMAMLLTGIKRHGKSDIFLWVIYIIIPLML